MQQKSAQAVAEETVAQLDARGLTLAQMVRSVRRSLAHAEQVGSPFRKGVLRRALVLVLTRHTGACPTCGSPSSTEKA